jgi:hypothetical protein
MIALYNTSTGELVSYGTTAPDPVPNGMSVLDLGSDTRLSTGFGHWDTVTRTVQNVIPSPVDIAANDAEIGNKIETVDMPAMQAIINQTNADIRTDPSQEIKDIARAIRRLDRKVQGLLDGTE